MQKNKVRNPARVHNIKKNIYFYTHKSFEDEIKTLIILMENYVRKKKKNGLIWPNALYIYCKIFCVRKYLITATVMGLLFDRKMNSVHSTRST